MYHHLRGKLIEIASLEVVLETDGVGWQVKVPLSTSGVLRESKGEEVLLYTHLLVRDDDLRLFGFATPAERQVFRTLLSVSGTGPAIALQALSAFSAAELVEALSTGDSTALRRIKGVGKKLAERLILELEDKAKVLVRDLAPAAGARPSRDEPPAASIERVVGDAARALLELGYPARDASRRAEDAMRALAEQRNGETPSVEAVIREALRQG